MPREGREDRNFMQAVTIRTAIVRSESFRYYHNYAQSGPVVNEDHMRRITKV